MVVKPSIFFSSFRVCSRKTVQG